MVSEKNSAARASRGCLGAVQKRAPKVSKCDILSLSTEEKVTKPTPPGPIPMTPYADDPRAFFD